MPNGKFFFLQQKYTIFPGLSLTIAPILLITNPLERKSPKLFHFEQMWLTDPSFPSLVEDSWKASKRVPFASSSLSKFPRRLDFLTEQIRAQNKYNFGNLFQCKNRILARLRGLQVALTRKPSAFLYLLKQQLTQKYNAILQQENLYWQLKSRIMWLNYGDANTKYFHLKTIQQRSQLRVVT